MSRLKTACLYGANALYLGGQRYGLRARADNFTEHELKEGVRFAHEHNVRIYVVLNAFLHDDDMDRLDEFCEFLESIGVDAVIASDLGVIRTIRRNCNLEVHLSTQASCLNRYGAQLWKRLGVSRIIVGRELSIEEAGRIKQESGVGVEMFLHGAMCMSYSGHCTISNFTAGRDANRGGCIQSCRFPYKQTRLETAGGMGVAEDNTLDNLGEEAHFMSSKDLFGSALLNEFFRYNIDSLKIEGRMKSALYLAVTCRTYRKLIDEIASGSLTERSVRDADEELLRTLNRGSCEGSLKGPAGRESVYEPFVKDDSKPDMRHILGTVLETTRDRILLQLKAPLELGNTLEFLPFRGESISWMVDSMRSIDDVELQSARQDSVISLPKTSELVDVAQFNVVRKSDTTHDDVL
ncbi:MAG: U32 family peptidase [Bdellovibrionales bacterium]|nr:U32 family peptidase [Bdellovibrionales bacterium]